MSAKAEVLRDVILEGVKKAVRETYPLAVILEQGRTFISVKHEGIEFSVHVMGRRDQ